MSNRPTTASSIDNADNERSQPGRNWSRSARRSAPQRITNIADHSQYLTVPIGFAAAAAPAGPSASNSTGASHVARRLPVVKSVDQRNFDLSAVAPQRRRRARDNTQQRQGVAFGAVQFDDEPGRRRSSVRIAESAASGDTVSVNTRDGDDEDDVRIQFPPARADGLGTGTGSGRFFHSGTGDIGDDDDDDDSDSSYASFTELMQKKTLFSSATSSDQDTLFDGDVQPVGTVDDTKLATSVTAPADDKSISPTVHRVYRSFYEGEVFSTGALKASLKTGTNTKMAQRELTRPLFRWIHVENPTMNFAAFAQFALSIPWLTEGQKKIVDGIFKTARTKSERSLSNFSNANSTATAASAKKGSYVEPEYYEESVKQTVYQGFRSRRQKTETIRWICIPYFFVREPDQVYKRGQSRKGTDHSFPAEYNQPSILLPPLDSGYVAEGGRFQVAQLWVLIIGESLILTCARRGIDDVTRIKRKDLLSDNIVDVQTLPPANPNNRSVGDRAPVLVVSDGGIRTWLLPVEKCTLWPEFTANFAELGVDLFDGWDLMYQDYKLMSKDWPQLIAQAKKSSVRLVLEKKDDSDDDDDDSENYVSEPDDDEEAAAAATNPGSASQPNDSPKPLDLPPPDVTIEQWHVFTLLATTPAELTLSESNSMHPQPGNKNLNVDEKILKEDADDVNSYLSQINRRQGEKEAYKNCNGATYTQVHDYAKTLLLDTESDPDGVNTDRIRLVTSARHMFTFFYPITFEHEVTQKYWGAVLRIIQTEQRNPAFFHTRVRRIRFIHRVVDNLKEELFSRRSPEYNTTNVPHEFVQAFLMLLMFLILFTTDQWKRSGDYTRRCRTLLAQGKFKVIRRLQTVSLREKEAVLPLGVACLLIGKLLENARGDQDFTDRQRLLQGYFGDLQKLIDSVRLDPLSRKYQDQFVVMKTEFESVLATIEDQQRVLVALDDGVTELEAKSVVAPVGQENRVKSREAIVLETSMENMEQTQFSFVQMERRRAELESWHFRTIEIAKDKQEKASLTFTTVTVLFLPLTLLASIFGMNTNDIRNLNENQWLFWLCAAPMCIIGLVIWLWYLGTLKTWLRSYKNYRKS